ncbi:DUF4907 domain-containing protein [Mariniflexile gromovii]|uniref:DUF4907 domain-containing protein n=1 Tax=Mariniflexile gromovii TaxID=362523 RepID=A0ABS4BX95_9FLAO|nr:DUF4907 domain-containing protein [Mariniflexile gromovii]MBP0905206.1 DUF4907 domain-containing protein [Mariniflexile gromovii]
MNKKSKYVIALLLILSVILIGVIISKTNVEEPFNTKVFKTDSGYGYSISFRNTLLIKQDYIPTIQNNVSFCTPQDAQKVADLVKKKLNHKENPKITLSELKQLGIKLNCIN